MSSPPSQPPTVTASATKFKPRTNVQRKTKAETERFLQEEAERSKTRTISEKPTAPRGGARGARGGRTRSGVAPAVEPEKGANGARDSKIGRDIDTVGVFSAGRGLKPSKGKVGDRRGSSAGLAELLSGQPEVPKDETDGTIPPSEKTSKKKAKGKAKIADAVTEDIGAEGSADPRVPVKTVTVDGDVLEEEDEPKEERRDIERIWVSSEEDDYGDRSKDDDDEDEVISDRKRGDRANLPRQRAAGGGGLRPVRAPRTALPTEDEEIYSRTKKSGKTQKSKTTTSEAIDLDELELDHDLDSIREILPSSSPDKRKSHLKKHHGKSKDVKIASETLEERAERLRLMQDMNKLRSIFLPSAPESEILTAKGKGKATTTDEDEGRLFLMQFPPITPFLTDPNAPPPPDDGHDEVIEVKEEGSAQQPTSTSNSMKAPPPPPPPPPQPGSGPSLKREPDTTKASTQQASDTFFTASSTRHLPSGLVGKLNVHASGKVTLDWGGTDMEVRLGSDVGFLQDAVVIQPPKQRVEGESATSTGAEEGAMQGVESESGDGKGVVYALGQVEGKMVIVPDWGKLYD